MSAHTRPDDAPLPLPGVEHPHQVHAALAALSRAVDVACTRAAFGAPVSAMRADLDVVERLTREAREAIATLGGET